MEMGCRREERVRQGAAAKVARAGEGGGGRGGGGFWAWWIRSVAVAGGIVWPPWTFCYDAKGAAWKRKSTWMFTLIASSLNSGWRLLTLQH